MTPKNDRIKQELFDLESYVERMIDAHEAKEKEQFQRAAIAAKKSIQYIWVWTQEEGAV